MERLKMGKLNLEDLGLSERALICVKRFGITSIDELVNQMDTFTRHAPRIAVEVKAALEAVQAKQGCPETGRRKEI
jgi:DNA-directed RNA polymerase alpha subunit